MAWGDTGTEGRLASGRYRSMYYPALALNRLIRDNIYYLWSDLVAINLDLKLASIVHAYRMCICALDHCH